MAPHGDQGTHNVTDSACPGRAQSSAVAPPAAAMAVLKLSEPGWSPGIRGVAEEMGMSRDGARKRLLAAADQGWLRHYPGRSHGAFVVAPRLLRYVTDEAGE